MIAIAIEHVQDVITEFEKDIYGYISRAVKRLELWANDKTLTPAAKTYVEKLAFYLPVIVIAEPNELDEYVQEFKRMPFRKGSQDRLDFKNLLEGKLGYINMRDNFFGRYFQKIGIKACIYCNAHLTVSVNSFTSAATGRRPVVKAKFQVDHYRPSSEFPYLSISLFNLYPTCGSCNNCKSDGAIYFSLYELKKNIKETGFEFTLDAASRARYMLNVTAMI
jgi:hypothetical protein